MALVLAIALMVLAVFTLESVSSGRWGEPAGGLPHGAWLSFTFLVALLLLATAWGTSRVLPSASTGFSITFVCWLLPTAAGFAQTPTSIKPGLLAVPVLLVPAVTEVSLGLWPGKQPPRIQRRVARPLTWLLSGVAFVLLALGADPFGDPSCRRTCLSANVLLQQVMTTREAMTLAGVLAALATGCGVWAAARPIRSWPVLASLFSLVTIGAIVVVLNLNPGDTGADRRHLEDLLTVALAIAPASVLIALAVLGHRRRRVEQVAAQLANGRTSNGVQFAVGTPRCWVEADGSPATEPAESKTLVLQDSTGPVVRWAGVNMRGADLDIHPAIWLALDNSRLSASMHAQVRELRASQGRIVSAADEERARIGRDLHDRTQQRLVGASLHLRHATARADPDTANALHAAEVRLQPTLDALREVSRGPFPETLSEDGLRRTLDDWAADAGARFVVDADPGRLPAQIERAAFAAATQSATDPSSVFVTLGRDESWLHLKVTTTASFQRAQLTALADRVGASGGTLSVSHQAGGASTLEVELPCE